MNRVGIITYHAAYNYGSALQAYATQEAVKKCGCDPVIINYRMDEQKKYYSLYRIGYGYKVFLRDLSMFPAHIARKKRKERFESFINNRLALSEEFSTPEEFDKYKDEFDYYISGSDQIWNKHSCELERNDWKFMNPYLLKDVKGKKISYASSVGRMSDEELHKIEKYILDFDYISMREQSSSNRLSNLINRKVEWVIDPTFLLDRDQWLEELNIKRNANNNEAYILLYWLGGVSKLAPFKKQIEEFSISTGHKLLIVTPFILTRGWKCTFENRFDLGPIEFLDVLNNAKYVITDSFHGTALSVNLKKSLFSMCPKDGAEYRKTEMLSMFGLKNRVVDSSEPLYLDEIDYTKVDRIINEQRAHSLEVLRRELN